MLNQTPVQIAWVTRDVAATEAMLTALLGARKWTRMPGVHFAPKTCTFGGEAADFLADISLSYAGDMQLEVIAPVSGTSIYSEFLDTVGAGLHHVCIEAPDDQAFEQALADADRDGAPVVQDGVMPGGMRFAYVAAPDAGVPFIEIACIPTEIKKFFDYIKQQQHQEK
ncbi:VOC family protein [Mycobacterium sp. OTB74]|uniref:VOC family protein n=1 Tax=Mycobacterium sp. OTB74 TaxID=1853452 RepID=UPI002473A399|nr:VOC family protein [Mycobacterium sp. OTB74]MDH6246587.1 catechol 2,3-dioxygenase-like lactoylglutathione lyase family enzyme [Mycobacterium sp. OTB74]